MNVTPQPQCLLWEACKSGDVHKVPELLANPQVDVNSSSPDRLDTPLHLACRFGRAEVVRLLLRHPAIEVDLGNAGGASPFNIACQEGHRDVADMMLADQRIQPNMVNFRNATPLYKACQNGHLDVLDTLLMDRRVEVNTPTESCTPLWKASENGRLDVVLLLLASDYIVDTTATSLPGAERWHNTTAATWARLYPTLPRYQNHTPWDHDRCRLHGPEIASLIESYEGDPLRVRVQLRSRPEIRSRFIARLFGVVIFFVDNLLRPSQSTVMAATTAATMSKVPEAEVLAVAEALRFLQIAARLPLDLQMVLCNRAFSSARDVVPSHEVEPCFRWLARSSTWL